jgi:acyl dehydratase
MPAIPSAVRALVGREVDRRRAVVSTLEFQRWAAAVGDHNPLYFDADFARAHGYRDVVMPPMYVGNLTSGVRHLDDLRPDGSPVSIGGLDVPIPHERRMAAGTTVESLRPVYGGDEITAVTRLGDMVMKEARSGPFVLVELYTRYTHQDGRTVYELTSGVILR